MSAAWDMRLAEFERCKAAQAAFYANVLNPAIERHDQERERLEATYGSYERASENPIGGKISKAAYQVVAKAEADFSEIVSAVDVALEVLMLTPAPDLAALLIKARMIEEREFWEIADNLAMHPVVALRQDLEALTA